MKQIYGVSKEEYQEAYSLLGEDKFNKLRFIMEEFKETFKKVCANPGHIIASSHIIGGIKAEIYLKRLSDFSNSHVYYNLEVDYTILASNRTIEFHTQKVSNNYDTIFTMLCKKLFLATATCIVCQQFISDKHKHHNFKNKRVHITRIQDTVANIFYRHPVKIVHDSSIIVHLYLCDSITANLRFIEFIYLPLQQKLHQFLFTKGELLHLIEYSYHAYRYKIAGTTVVTLTTLEDANTGIYQISYYEVSPDHKIIKSLSNDSNIVKLINIKRGLMGD